jgi:DNA (cytosine-5)-methyltransferase 1
MNKHKFPYKWTLKDAVFTKDKGKIFSCFACGGGSTMGDKLAGFDVIGCNEIDPKIMKVYIENHHPKYSYLESIQTFKLRDDLPDELYHLDILSGSPPCSSFSMAGSREKGWGVEKKFREGQSLQVLDTLFFDYIDLAKKLQPKVVIAENVKGLLMGNARTYVKRIYRELTDAGYYVQHYLLDASKMGVPQRRERVFFIALRNDLCEQLQYKDKFFNYPPSLDMNFNEKPILFGEVRSEFGGADYSHTDRAKLIPHRIKTDKSINDINMRLHNKFSGFNELIIHDDKVCPTITAGSKNWRYFDGVACSDEDYINCSSFPSDFNFLAKTKDDPKYLMGMSVPPIMSAQVTSRIYEQWLSKLK